MKLGDTVLVNNVVWVIKGTIEFDTGYRRISKLLKQLNLIKMELYLAVKTVY
jgi:hypothetical protein